VSGAHATPDFRDTLLLVTNEGLGHAEPELGRKLFDKYLELLEANGTYPGAIAFYTQGVKLCCEGSISLERLRALEAKGVRLLLCKTCVDAFGLTDSVRAGVIAGMGDIQAAQVLARKVITL
jgi:intracellular sulfur oxidation DsrE/DsrF family protein